MTMDFAKRQLDLDLEDVLAPRSFPRLADAVLDRAVLEKAVLEKAGQGSPPFEVDRAPTRNRWGAWGAAVVAACLVVLVSLRIATERAGQEQDVPIAELVARLGGTDGLQAELAMADLAARPRGVCRPLVQAVIAGLQPSGQNLSLVSRACAVLMRRRDCEHEDVQPLLECLHTTLVGRPALVPVASNVLDCLFVLHATSGSGSREPWPVAESRTLGAWYSANNSKMVAASEARELRGLQNRIDLEEALCRLRCYLPAPRGLAWRRADAAWAHARAGRAYERCALWMRVLCALPHPLPEEFVPRLCELARRPKSAKCNDSANGFLSLEAARLLRRSGRSREAHRVANDVLWRHGDLRERRRAVSEIFAALPPSARDQRELVRLLEIGWLPLIQEILPILGRVEAHVPEVSRVLEVLAKDPRPAVAALARAALRQRNR